MLDSEWYVIPNLKLYSMFWKIVTLKNVNKTIRVGKEKPVITQIRKEMKSFRWKVLFQIKQNYSEESTNQSFFLQNIQQFISHQEGQEHSKIPTLSESVCSIFSIT